MIIIQHILKLIKKYDIISSAISVLTILSILVYISHIKYSKSEYIDKNK
jgi:hypothetical protein